MKKFAIDVHFDVAHCIIVEATSREDAEHIVENKILNGEITSKSPDFEQTDDYECFCSGEEDESGEIVYN